MIQITVIWIVVILLLVIQLLIGGFSLPLWSRGSLSAGLDRLSLSGRDKYNTRCLA